MQPLPHELPSLPEIGYPESFYAKRVRQAELAGDVHAREAYKVGQYVTLASDPHLDWESKLRYFKHVLRRHCNPPPLPSDQVWLFYQNLADLVRRHAGREALRLASAEDDLYAMREAAGVAREWLVEKAETFFRRLMGSHDVCPPHFNEEDWQQLLLLRSQWVPKKWTGPGSLKGDARQSEEIDE